MNLRQKITLSLLLSIALGGAAFAQPINIPDPNLRAAIEDALEHDRVTQHALSRLEGLDANDRNIANLSGLEYAVNLEWLFIATNPITDLAPLSGMKRLETLHIYNNPISDISPLENLVNLKYLNAGGCRITDISALANLTKLTKLNLSWNRVTDISALANLNNLERLEISNNPIVDYHILDGLSLDYLVYDQVCDMPPLPLQSRLDNRTFPSVFSAWGNIGGGWSSVLNQPHLSDFEQMAQHDLYFNDNSFYQYFLNKGNDWDLRSYLPASIQLRGDYIKLNPHMIFILTLSMRDADKTLFPENSPYWVKSGGSPVEGWPGTYLLDFTNSDVQDMIVGQALAVERCGLYDGVFFDWWSEKTAVLADDSNLFTGGYIGFEAEQQARDIILDRIRAAARPNFLILVNTNRSIIPRTGRHINGSFMETLSPSVDYKGGGTALVEKGLSEVEATLAWLEENLREPRINSLEGWGFPNESPDSPRNRRWMRAFTTLSLTHSDGYVLFNDGIQHAHYWYDFWDADLGRPVGEKAQLYQGTDGLYIREYTNGWAVYNHSGVPQVIRLPEEVQGVASGLVNVEHALANLDGEMYLKAVESGEGRVASKNPADVNGDGVVNIFDLTLVAQAFGKDGLEADVNGDGVVNVFDLVQVAGAIGGGAAAPSAYSLDLLMISATDVAKWLAHAQGLDIGDANLQRGIRFLEGLLAVLTPKETTLLPNYPNPFNPETWIPYRLAREAEVVITIYDTKGTLVRRLALGNQAAGYYAERGKAAYWDGRNEDGEAVASGIYIYQFRAGDYAASRRMVIVK